jgi:undecaprenyl-diphosphatase
MFFSACLSDSENLMNETMSWLQAIVLGISQGLTEFLPISSSAHEMIINHLMGWKDGGAAFTAFTQVGTELAVLIYFRKDLVGIISTWLRSLTNKQLRSDPQARMAWYVIIGTVPIAVFGIVFKDIIETDLRNLWIVSATLIGLGLVLLAAEKFAKHVLTDNDLTTKRALGFGFAQALALIPGVSRSGGTISAGLFMGFKRDVAARYSFLLAIPAVLSSALLEIPKISDTPLPTEVATNWPATLLATGIAFVIGYIVIAQLMKYLATKTFVPFVIYRVALGVVLIGLLATHTITAS